MSTVGVCDARGMAVVNGMKLRPAAAECGKHVVKNTPHATILRVSPAA